MGIMQLVRTDAHNGIPHIGDVSQRQLFTGKIYF
ncbi:HNH endonuclease [Pectobacterium parmentieri]